MQQHTVRGTLVGLAALALSVAPSAALAAGRPVGDCGVGFTLMSVEQIIATIAAPGSIDAIRAGDVNGDGLLCVKIIPNNGGPPQFDPAFAFVDNTAQVP